MVQVFTGPRTHEPGGFTVTNEDVKIIRNFASEVKPKYTVAITGGGEVPLLALLHNSEFLMGVEHSIRGTFATAAKSQALSIQGAKIKETISKGEPYFRRFMETEVFPDMSSDMRYVKDLGPWGTLVAGVWRYISFEKAWMETPDHVLESARERLGNFMIANMYAEDVEMLGLFDMVYASNAPKQTGTRFFTRLAAPGGHLIVSEPVYINGLERLRSVPDPDVNRMWTYELYRVSEAASSPTYSDANIFRVKDKSSQPNLGL